MPTAATHRYVPLSGSAKDRRRRVRALRRAYPFKPIDAIDVGASYLTDRRPWDERKFMVTTPGQ